MLTAWQLRECLHAYFSSGWRFLLPYAVVYGIGQKFDLAPRLLHQLYNGLHVVTAALLLLWAAHLCAHALGRTWNWQGALFWTVLCGLFGYLGAYLPHPLDPWMHASRIFQWEFLADLDQAQRTARQGYFLFWTLLAPWTPPGRIFPQVDLIAALSSVLFAFQVWRLARAFDLTPTVSRLAVLAVLALTGIGALSFVRYYALAPAILAQVATFAFVVELTRLLRGERSAVGWLVASAIVAGAHHLQALPYQAMALAALALAYAARRLPRAGLMATTLLILGFAAGAVVGSRVLERFPGAATQVTAFGSYPLWDFTHPATTNLALSGMLGIAAALLLLRTRPLLAWLTLLPVLALLWPPVALPLAVYIGQYDPLWPAFTAHRVLFAFPPALALVVLAADHLPRLRWPLRGPAIAGTVAAFLSLSLIPQSPFFGRGPNLLRPPAQLLDLRALQPAAIWMFENRDPSRLGLVETDRATREIVFLRSGNRGNNPNNTKRLSVWAPPLLDVEDPGAASQWLRLVRPAALLLVDPQATLPIAVRPEDGLPPFGDSALSVSLNLHANQRFARAILPTCLAEGWSVTEVPPFYLLVEPNGSP